MLNETVVKILGYGVIGLGFLLALLSYRLLSKEQQRDQPRLVMLRSIMIFMAFSIALCVVGLCSNFLDENPQKKVDDSQDTFKEHFSKLRLDLAHGEKPLQFKYGEIKESAKETLKVKIPAGSTVRYLMAVSENSTPEFGYWADYPDGGGVEVTESEGQLYKTGYISSKNDKSAEVGLYIEMKLGSAKYGIETYFVSQKVYDLPK